MSCIKAASVYLASMICVIALCGHAHAQTGKPHTCQQWESANAGVEGITTLDFRITKEGGVAAPRVTTSSGSAEQDAAALQCVQLWRYRHVTKDGVPIEMPVEIPWIADIAWNPTIPPALTQQLRRCAKALRAKLSDYSPAYNATEYSITYDEHYRVAAITVTRSSGDVALDKTGADCVMSSEETHEIVVIGGRINILQQNTFPAKITWKD